ncbi:hypothetical protein HYPSUDRAFT_213236 [Hypholoma sublateritium FD-334 SS-4]|uniref:Uncharacterized protein n=1 Tax=Hypholoma sublateritium (strain FD-334 SS-4) TaxID=945553 RepID=A0A0D2P700_HYPSF|nr:hypothetical protein HYPSUDRAFT_213236 [Hypholoma sublateritium FD-334 SS-4]
MLFSAPFRSSCTGSLAARSRVCSQMVAETSKRFSSTHSTVSFSGTRRRGAHKILTLRPECILSSGQKILDISGRTGKTAIIDEEDPFFLRYTYSRDNSSNTRRVVAPPNSTGFFYYHRHPDQPEVAGQLRFRVCDDATRFDQGHDLDGKIAGVPWSIHLWKIVKHWKQILSLLLDERLADQGLLDDVKRLDPDIRSSIVLYSLSEPMVLHLDREKINVAFVTRKNVLKILIRRLFVDQASTSPSSTPYTGIIKARFELSDLPEHEKHGPTLVLRILDILQPVRPVSRWYNGRLPSPTPGALFQHYRQGTHQPWFLPVKKLGTGYDFDFPGLVSA